MPIELADESALLERYDFVLWREVPECWLRHRGRTRVLIIDDQWTRRQDLFSVTSEAAPPSPEEEQLRQWLNVEIEFVKTPQDYHWNGAVPGGTFDAEWFSHALDAALDDARPVAAVLVDLLYGTENRINDASGPKFLSILRQRLPDVPVLILSNLEETHEVRGLVKEGGKYSTGDVSFQDYLPKRVANGKGLLDRMIEKLIAWADLSDPSLCAFSLPMRRLARQMRRVVLLDQTIAYQEENARFPKPVLIKGSIGSGKNFIARRLHGLSSRRGVQPQVIDFSGHESENFTTTFFGAAMFTGATQRFIVRPDNAAIVDEATTRRQGGRGSAHLLHLSSIGQLHRAHIAGDPPRPNDFPLRGTILLDEIGVAPEVMQTRLLRVFNRGRFVPHLASVEIPMDGALDVWFLLTLSPEGQDKLRDDLATRLGSAHHLEVPSLTQRSEDVLPLALQCMGASDDNEPSDFLTDEAVAELEQYSKFVEVRELRNLVARLADETDKRPYSGAEVKKSAVVRAGSSKAPRKTDGPTSDVGVASDLSSDRTEATTHQPDALSILSNWRKAPGANYRLTQDPRQLRGHENEVLGGAAAAVLSYLRVCAKMTATDGRCSPTGVWKFFSGLKKVSTADARTAIGNLFVIHKGAALDAIRLSDTLLVLAIDAAPRNKSVKELIARLSKEPQQVDRITRLRANSAEGEAD